jgi:ABC-type amino acid transport substrate-binding protein
MNGFTRVRAMLLLAIALAPGASLMAQGTLERIADRNEFRIGYRTDARPLSFEKDGAAQGYSVDFCRRIAVAVREHLKLPDMKVTYVPVTSDDRVDGDIDIECGATTITLGRLERVDFTLMTFVTGGTVLSMAANRVANLEGLAGKRVAVVRGTSTADALEAALREKLIDARVVTVADRTDGMSRLRSGDVAGFASDQIVLIGVALEAIDARETVNFSFADEFFSYEPYAFMVRRNDAEFRLIVNRAIAQMFRSGQFAQVYQTWIGNAGVQPSPMLIAMYQMQSLAE